MMRRGEELKTPVQTRRRLAAAAVQKDTFPGRLDWKLKRFGVPVTSTPKPDKFSEGKGRDDVHNCFGFDDSEDENNYSALMSPIINEGPATKIPALDAVLSRRKKVVNLDDSQVLQENNSNSPKVPPTEIENIQPPSSKVESKKQVSSNLPDKDLDKVDNVKPASPVKNEKLKTVRTGKTKLAAPRKQPTRNAKKLQEPTARLQAQELYQQNDLESSQKLVEDLSFDAQSEIPCSDIYVKAGNPRDGFNVLLARYGKADDESDEELHVNVENIMKTYSSHNSSKTKTHPQQIPSKSNAKKIRRKPRSLKSSIKTGTRQDESEDSSDDLDPVLKKWLEEKNKEFDDVLHVPLVIAGGAPQKRSSRISKARRVKS